MRVLLISASKYGMMLLCFTSGCFLELSGSPMPMHSASKNQS